ncbi:MAG: hypothetical protein CL910_10175 [Deltaproteobacteria bacterium]|jgi:ABC-type uncharacterized transport system permease subunit|nr:hypothetical protein [Deltaproteobacteria bacterium]
MGLLLHQLASTAYLLAAIIAALGFAMRWRLLGSAPVVALGLGATLQFFGFWQLHTIDSPPSMASLPLAVSFMGWVGTMIYLVFVTQLRIRGLAVIVAPAVFVACFTGSLLLEGPLETAEPLHPVWSHLHVLLSSCGLATLGVSAAAGLLYIVHHRAIKMKRKKLGGGYPSLETLDRVNTIALALGFLLLTLGLVTGVLWVQAKTGNFWEGGLHANATLAAWLLNAVAAWGRFGVDVGARRTALLSAGGFAFLVLAVVGLGVAS